MDLMHLIFTLVIVGVVMWAINSFIPMQANIKTILNVAVVILVLLWLLNQFTGFVPHLRL